MEIVKEIRNQSDARLVNSACWKGEYLIWEDLYSLLRYRQVTIAGSFGVKGISTFANSIGVIGTASGVNGVGVMGQGPFFGVHGLGLGAARGVKGVSNSDVDC